MDNGAMLRKQKYAQTSTSVYTESGAQWQPQAEDEAAAEASATAHNSTATPEMLRGATAKVWFRMVHCSVRYICYTMHLKLHDVCEGELHTSSCS